jgi:uncharacterized protein YecE (DUF72 family)
MVVQEADPEAPLPDAAGATAAKGKVLFGTQGFNNPEWTDLVYPRGLPQKQRLAHYARIFDLLEIDSTYYRPPSISTVDAWVDSTPETFTIAAKAPQAITQDAKLAGVDARNQLAYFFEVMRRLGPRLGPLVLQMSPGFVFPRDFPGMEQTLRLLPELGSEGLRLAMEFRHPTWVGQPAVLALLRESGVAWIWNDWDPTERYLKPMPRAIDEPQARHSTCDDWGYVRLVGNHQAEINLRRLTIDRGKDFERWGKLIMSFRRDREDRGIYVLINNHYAGCSPKSIQELQRVLGTPVVVFGGPTDAGSSAPAKKAGGATRAAAVSGQAPLFRGLDCSMG